MSTELDILKQISENKGEAPIRLIAKQLKIGNDYARYLCKELLKKGLVKKLNKKDWYKTSLKREKEAGKKEKLIRKPLSKRHFFRKKETKKKIPARLASSPPELRSGKSGVAQRETGRRKKALKILPLKIQPEISIFLPSEEKTVKEKIDTEKRQLPENKFEKIIKGFKKIFRFKKD